MANAWKIARKSNAQLPLAIVIALAIVLALLGKAQSGLLDQARVHVTDMMAPVLEKVRAPVAGKLPITFPHELARAMAAEQIYRAITTLRGHPYPR